jgi:hypothetical protein
MSGTTKPVNAEPKKSLSVVLKHCSPLIYYYVLHLNIQRGTLTFPGGGGVTVVQGTVTALFYYIHEIKSSQIFEITYHGNYLSTDR